MNLNNSKTWNSILYILKDSKNNLDDFTLSGIHYVILHKYSLSLHNKDTNNRLLLSKSNDDVFIEISKLDTPMTNYDSVTEKKDYFYIQKICKQQDLTKQYLLIKVHKNFINRFCF